jgi:putative nucleic acid binding protein
MRKLIAVGTFLVLCSAVVGQELQKPGDKAFPIKTIPFSELVQTFATNEVRAEILYEGKQIRVRGILVRVVASRYGSTTQGKDTYIVEFRPEKPSRSNINVLFFFDRADRASLAELNAGQEVTIQGSCGRPSIYTGDQRQNQLDYLEVPVRECKILNGK